MNQNLKKKIRSFLDIFIDPLNYHKRLEENLHQLMGQQEIATGQHNEKLDAIHRDLAGLRGEVDETISRKISRLVDESGQIHNLMKANYDQIQHLRERLKQVRSTPEYGDVFKEQEPLISVRIATYNNGRELVEKAVRSVLSQTYQNFEIIIVGDHCIDDTEERLAALADERINFVNLPFRSVYPKDQEDRWMVAGSPAMNLGAEMAKGAWIAPLDDDDEFLEDHLEKLLRLASAGRYEMVYGKVISKNLNSGEETEIWAYPPELGQFSFHGGMYMKLLGFFEWDASSWVMGEPADWNLCRRMLSAGVRIGTTEDVVAKIYFERPKKR